METCRMSVTPRYKALGIALLLLLASTTSGADDSTFKTQLSVFGTRVEIAIWGVEPAVARQAVMAVSADFQIMHRDWHAWKPGKLVILNQAFAQRKTITVDDSILTLVRQAKQYYRSSDGMFNPALGQLIELWGFHNDQPPKGPPPDKQVITSLLGKHPTMNDVVIRGNQISSHNPDVQLDFGGFAKGHAVDLAVKRLRELGINNAFINAGGDLRVIGRHGRQPWRVGIRHPQGGGILAWLDTDGDEGVFTSGNYERYREFGGIRYPHIIDPRSGYPVNEIVSATVVHKNGSLADAAATALTVAGTSSWKKISHSMGVKTVMLVDSKGTVYMTPSMAKRIHFSGTPPDQVIVDPESP
jgi:thiamine biosynthesis lipoprotein